MITKFFNSISAIFAALALMASYSPESLHSQAKTRNQATVTNHRKNTASKPIHDKWALVIGISKFKDKELNLKYSAKDACDFVKYLTTEGNFKKDHVRLLVNEKATKRNILRLLADQWLPKKVHKDDLVLIYVSSHGSPSHLDAGGLNYILPYDADVDSLYATAIPLRVFSDLKNRVRSDKVLLVLDACNSGAADSNALLTSSASCQSSWESKQYPNSVFTRQLIDALRANGTKTKLSEAFEQLKVKVCQEVMHDRGEIQTPSLKTYPAAADIMLAAPVDEPQPAG